MKVVHLFFFIICIFHSCTFVRTVAFFTPDTDDHEQIFSCDTSFCHQLAEKFTYPVSSKPFYSIDKWVPSYARLGAIDLRSFMENSKTAGFVVIHKDSILYQYLKEGHTMDKQRIVFSVTKAITCMLVAIAHEKGYIDIHQSVAEFFS